MSDRRCSACGIQVPPEEDYCPRDGVACFPPVRMLGAVIAGEPSLTESADYERVERELCAPSPAGDGFATVPLAEEWV